MSKKPLFEIFADAHLPKLPTSPRLISKQASFTDFFNKPQNTTLRVSNDAELKTWVEDRLASGTKRPQVFRDLVENGRSPELASILLGGFKPRLKMASVRDASQRENAQTSAGDFFAFANIDLLQRPEAIRAPDDRLQLFSWPDFLDAAQCKNLIETMEPVFKASTVVDQELFGNDGYRTSSTVYLPKTNVQINQQLTQQISDALGIDPRYCEGVQLQRYEPDQEYKIHADFFQETSPNFHATLGEQGQRTWSCLIYLNDDFEAGQTRFDKLDLELKARRGCALFWNNLSHFGVPNDWTYHAGMPVLLGRKYVVTAWFRERPKDFETDVSLHYFATEFAQAKQLSSDINQHLDLLYQLASEVDHVTEFGVRAGASTRAFLAAGVCLRSYDLVLNEVVGKLFQYGQRHERDVVYQQADVLTLDIEETDLLFIDTWHCYEQLKAELARHSHRVKKYIAFHDTQTFGTVSEQILDTNSGQSDGIRRYKTGSNGLLPAIIEFVIAQQGRWQFKIHRVNNNGLTVLERMA